MAECLLKTGRAGQALDAIRLAVDLAQITPDGSDARNVRMLHVSILTHLERVDEALAAMGEWFARMDQREPRVVKPAADLVTLVLRVRADDRQACEEAAHVCDQVFEMMARPDVSGRSLPSTLESLRQRLVAVREACAAGDRAAALSIAQSAIEEE
jgi:hypothetical protein